jgi:hypothetical protein
VWFTPNGVRDNETIKYEGMEALAG